MSYKVKDHSNSQLNLASETVTQTIHLTWKELGPPLIGIAIAFLAALWVAAYIMRAPADEFRLIAQLLAMSSLLSLSIGYVIFALGQRWLPTIRLKIILAYSLGIVVAIVNIYANSQLMFVSEHDSLFLGLLLIFASILSASFGYLLAARMTQSLCLLQEGAQQLATGDFSVRVHLTEVDELADVAEAFNMMADELEQSFARQKEMEQARRNLIAAVSHDLRTPLTSMRAMIEAISDEVVTDPETVARYHHNIELQIESLSKLINDLFELSRLEAGQIVLNLETVNLNDLLSDVLETMQAQANHKGIILQACFEENLPPVRVECLKIQRVLYNLVQNGIRHTPPDGLIKLTTQVVPEGVQVEVSDTGEGILPEDVPHIFEQFYRGEKSRSRETGGAGLGLAIVKRIIEAHNGRIWLDSHIDRGTHFRFVLPTNG